MKNKQKSQNKVQRHRINGIRFEIDEEGFVSTPDCGGIGHLEECIQVAEALSGLFAIGEEIACSRHQMEQSGDSTKSV